jgi:hypothetical protein
VSVLHNFSRKNSNCVVVLESSFTSLGTWLLPVGICPLPCFKWGRNVQRYLLDLVEKETVLVTGCQRGCLQSHQWDLVDMEEIAVRERAKSLWIFFSSGILILALAKMD